MEDIRFVKKDLAVILKLNKRIDYSDLSAVAKYCGQLEEEGLLTTSVGEKYRGKLMQIVRGDAGYTTCLFCDSETPADTVICEACMDRLRQMSAAHAHSEEVGAEDVPAEEEIAEEIPEECEPGEDGSLEEIPAEEEIAEEISAAAAERRGARRKFLVAAAAAAAVCLLAVGGYLLGASRKNSKMEKDILNYLGTLESDVYQNNEESRLLDIIADENGCVSMVWLRSDVGKDFHMNGLCVGDDQAQMEKCMDELDAILASETEMSTDTLFLQYTFQYRREKMTAGFTVRRGTVSDIIVAWQ